MLSSFPHLFTPLTLRAGRFESCPTTQSSLCSRRSLRSPSTLHTWETIPCAQETPASQLPSALGKLQWFGASWMTLSQSTGSRE